MTSLFEPTVVPAEYFDIRDLRNAYPESPWAAREVWESCEQPGLMFGFLEVLGLEDLGLSRVRCISLACDIADIVATKRDRRSSEVVRLARAWCKGEDVANDLKQVLANARIAASVIGEVGHVLSKGVGNIPEIEALYFASQGVWGIGDAVLDDDRTPGVQDSILNTCWASKPTDVNREIADLLRKAVPWEKIEKLWTNSLVPA